MTASDLTIAFGVGVVGSLHCVQMCGPIVLSYSLRSAGGPSMAAHCAYNLGRITMYMILGALAGWAGMAVTRAAAFAGLRQAAALVAGVLMIIAGVTILGWRPRGGLVQIGGGRFSGFFRQTAGRLLSSPGIGSKFALGFVLGLLPCGLLYAALLQAVGTSSFAAGAVTMLAFGLGTAGALIALGAFSSVIGRRLGRWSNLIAGVTVILVGLYLLWRGVMVGGTPLSCPFHAQP